MAYTGDILRYTISGKLASGNEVWNTSFYITAGAVSSVTDANLNIELGSATWTALITSMKLMLSPADTFAGVDVYFIRNGVSIAHAHSVVGAGAGTGGNPGIPPQCSIVCTLRTALSTRSGRGRMYFPATGVTVIAGGTASTTRVNDLVDKLAAHFSDVVSSGGHAYVVSQTLGAINAVVSVDADYIFDTQRRRRNKLTSARHSATV